MVTCNSLGCRQFVVLCLALAFNCVRATLDMSDMCLWTVFDGPVSWCALQKLITNISLNTL